MRSLVSMKEDAKMCANKANKKTLEFKVMADAHSDMFDIEIMNMMERSDSMEYNDDAACAIIRNQVELSYERNLESALKSLERSMMQCDESIVQSIEASAEAVEQLIPALEEKLKLRKQEMSVSHDCSKLLEQTVEKNYSTMRDGYLKLIKQVYEEASVQWNALVKLQQPNIDWHLQKLNSVIETQKNNPTLVQRREDILRLSEQRLNHFCDESFRKIKASKMYEEKELHLQKIDELNRSVHNWKSGIITENEDRLNKAEITLDAYYMSSVEEINDHMFDLQESLQQLASYDKTLEHLLVHAFQAELRLEKDKRKVSINANTSSTSTTSSNNNVSTSTSVATTTAPLAAAAVTAHLPLGEQSQVILANNPLQMGTMLRSLAHSCDLPAEKTEEILHYILFKQEAVRRK